MKNRSLIVSFSATIITMTIGILVIIGWYTHNDFLKSIVPGAVKMKFNVALGFIFSSMVLLLSYVRGKNGVIRRISITLSVVVSVIGLLTLTEYLFDYNSGIDEAFVRDETRTTTGYYAGRMSPLSAINFILIGAGLLLLNNVKAATFQFLYLFGIAFTSLLMLIGFNFIVDIPTFIRLAIHVAFGFITLSAAIYFAQPMLQQKISFERKLYTGFTATIILVVVITMFSPYYNNKRLAASWAIEQVNRIIKEVSQVESFAIDIESGGRGYIITADSVYLQHFEIGKKSIYNQIDKLKALTGGSASQRLRIDSLSDMVDKRIAFSIQCIQLINKNGKSGADELMATRKGNFYMDSIRKLTAELLKEENARLSQLTSDRDQSIASFNHAFNIFLGCVFVLLVIILFSIRKNTAIQKASEEGLTNLNNELEQKVKERTSNLALFRSIVNSSEDAIISKSMLGVITTWNHGAEKLFGYTTEEAVGRNIAIVIPKDRMNEEAEILSKITRGELVDHFETERLKKDGSTVPISLTVSPIFESPGVVTGASKIARNISDRKKVEVALKSSETLYRSLFENMLNGFVYCKVIYEDDKAIDYVCTAVNSAYETMTGLTNALGKKISELIPGIYQSYPEIFEMITRVSRSGKPERFETFILDRWLSVSLYCPADGYFIGLVDNITEQKLAAVQIEYQANLLKHVNDAVIATDDQIRVTSWNSAAELMFGWRHVEVLGRTAQEVLRSEMSISDREKIVKELIQQGSYRSEMVYLHKDGHPVNVEANTIALYNEHKQFAGILSVMRDITQRKEIETDLQESKYILKKAQEVGNIGSWAYDLGKGTIALSEEATRIYGLSVDQTVVPAELLMGMVHPEDKETTHAAARTAINFGQTYMLDHRILLKNGLVKWVHVRGNVTRDNHGKEGIFIGVSQDITERKNAEDRFRLVVEAAPNAMVLVNNLGLITLVNNQTEKIFGYSKQELIDQRIELLIPARFDERHQNHRTNYSTQQKIRQMGIGMELFAIRKDGTEFPVEVGLNPINSPEGNLVLASITDVTERRMAEASRLKSDFMANMSHELRTPLNAVLGFSELMIDKKVGDLNPKQLEYLNDIHASGSHLLKLINNILDLSKIESGKTELNIETFDVNEVMTGVISVLRALANKKHIQIQQNFSADIKFVSLDKGKFRQILYNLLSNAIKFTPEKGTVFIETAADGTNAFILDVSDTGIGISESDLKKLFIPFVQIDSGVNRRYEGTGLGLALTKNITTLHGGKIQVKSVVGRGSTFSVRLPVTYRKNKDADGHG